MDSKVSPLISTGKRALLSDFERMQDKGQEQIELGRKIRSFDTNPTDIINWYYANDPLKEWFAINSLMVETDPLQRGAIKNMFEYTFEVPETLAYGATHLIETTIYPHQFKDKTPEEIQEFYSRKAIEYGLHPEGILSGETMLGILRRDTEIDASILFVDDTQKKILVACDMLHAAYQETRQLQRWQTTAQAEAKKPFTGFYQDAIPVAALFYDALANPRNLNKWQDPELSTNSLMAMQQLCSIWIREAETLKRVTRVSFEHGIPAPIEVVEQTLVSTNGFCNMLSKTLIPRGNVVTNEGAAYIHHTALAVYTETIRKIFIGDNNDGLLSQSVPGIKGRLHEALWYLDFALLGAIEGAETPNVLPSLNFQDAPELGYPRLNRGFDFTVQCPNGDIERIQLKSSIKAAGRKHAYHPHIQEVVEANFMDAEPRRLAKKLAYYSRVLDNVEISAQEKAYIKEKLILPSVKSVYEASAQKNKRGEVSPVLARFAMTYFGEEPVFDSRMIEHPFRGQNRQQRRAERKSRKK